MTYALRQLSLTGIDPSANRLLRVAVKRVCRRLQIPMRGAIYVRRIPDGEMAVVPIHGGLLALLCRTHRRTFDLIRVSDDPEAPELLPVAQDLRAVFEKKLGARSCAVGAES